MLSPAKTPPHIVTLILLTAISVLALNMFLPSLPAIADEFDVSYGQANLAVAGFLFLSAGLQVVLGPFSDRFGRRRIINVTMAIFALSSFGCFLAQDFVLFMIFRFGQAGAVAGMAISRAVVRDVSADSDAVRKLALIGMAMSIVPMLGPAVGGFLQELFGWRSNFALFTLLGVGLFVLCWLDLGETNENPSSSFADQFKNYPALIRSQYFWGYTIVLSSSVGVFYTYIVGLPVFAAVVLGLSPKWIGVSVGLITFGFFFGNSISARVANEFSLVRMMIMGRIIAVIATLVGICLAVSGIVTFWSIVIPAIFCGFANGITLPSANTGVLSVEPKLAGTASGLSGALVVLFGAVVTLNVGWILTPENGPWMLMVLMMLNAVMGLSASFYVGYLDQKA